MGENFNRVLAEAQRHGRDCPQDLRPISEVVKSLALKLDVPFRPSSESCTPPTITKQRARAQALLKMPVLGVCSGCGGDAVHRHSPSNHLASDEFGLCEKCHRFVHEGIWRRA